MANVNTREELRVSASLDVTMSPLHRVHVRVVRPYHSAFLARFAADLSVFAQIPASNGRSLPVSP